MAGRWHRLLVLGLLGIGAAAASAAAASAAAASAAAASVTPLANPPTTPRLVIIIDDIGNRLAEGLAMVDLPAKLNIAVLPHTPHGSRLAARAHRNGKEVLLHAPMSALERKPLGPGALTPDLGEGDLRITLDDALATVPHARGVNNHMGSELTASAEPMRWLMAALSERGLYFVDSRTHKSTVAAQVAAEAGLPHLSRQVFLDNNREPGAIEERLEAALSRAAEEGIGVAIGHPYPETVAVLRDRLPGLAALGVELALVSEVVDPVTHRLSGRTRAPRQGNAFPGPLPEPASRRMDLLCILALGARPPLRETC